MKTDQKTTQKVERQVQENPDSQVELESGLIRILVNWKIYLDETAVCC